MKQQKRRETKKSKVAQSLKVGETRPDELPQIQDQLAIGKTLRFTTTGIGGSTSTTVTFANLLDAWLIAGTTTNGYQLFDFVKVRRVTVRAVSGSNSGGSTATVGIEFPGLVAGSNAGGRQASNSGMGISKAVMVQLRPDKMSAAGFFQPSSNAVAFVVRSTDENNAVIIGTIIDVELSFKNSADVSPAAVSSAIAGAVAGNLYYGGIDGGRLAATWARSVFVPRI